MERRNEIFLSPAEAAFAAFVLQLIQRCASRHPWITDMSPDTQAR
jgi:hypothetical protein